jgi:hypothetical protein
MPNLDFSVRGAAAVAYAAVPTLALTLAIANREPDSVRGVSLNVQVRIASAQRAYAPAEQDRLLDLFGEPSRWGQTLKSLLWSFTTVHVPGFIGETTFELLMPCTYDFEVVSARYCNALENGTIPLELLFSGSVFYVGTAGLQVEQISWAKETRFGLPVQVWHDVMSRYFPNSAWLRLDKDTFDRLDRYRARRSFPSWETALDSLLSASGAETPAEPRWTR